MKRAFIMVLDSFGIGATEDAERFGDVGEIMTDPLSLSVSCHIGPKALAIACTKKLSV